MSRLLSCLLASALPLVAQGPSLEPVRQAELAFAQLAGERGIRTAFRTWMTDEARVFMPRMTTAKVQYAPEPGDTGHLAWYPEAMGIAESGDLAWSLGPWTYAPSRGTPGRVHGHFLSLWRKQATGDWRVVADIGVPHPLPGVPGRAFPAGNTLGSQPGPPEDRAHPSGPRR